MLVAALLLTFAPAGCVSSPSRQASSGPPSLVSNGAPVPPRKGPSPSCRVRSSLQRQGALGVWGPECLRVGGKVVALLRQEQGYNWSRPRSSDPSILHITNVEVGRRFVRVTATARRPGLASLSAFHEPGDAHGPPTDEVEWTIQVSAKSNSRGRAQPDAKAPSTAHRRTK